MDFENIGQFTDLSYWKDIPNEQIPLWELRDRLSHFEGNFSLSEYDQKIADDVISSVVNNKEVDWSTKRDVSILAEAYIQRELAHNGYEIRCADLNTFPKSTVELKKYIYKVKTTQRLTRKLDQYKNKIRYKLSNVNLPKIPPIEFKTFYIDINITFWFMIGAFITLLYGIFYRPDLLLISIGVAYILSNCLAINIHEGWVHDLVKPKNRVIGFLMNYLSTMAGPGTSRLEWRYRHNYHHIHWKTEKDRDMDLLNLPRIPYLLNFRAKTESWEGEKEYQTRWKTYKEEEFSKLPIESQLLEKHNNIIMAISHAVVFGLFGIEMWAFFFLLQAYLFPLYIHIFNEYLTHYKIDTKEQEANSPAWFPICCGTAYHIDHHHHRWLLVLGPGWVKYFNIQYYFVKLFYNLNPKTITN